MGIKLLLLILLLAGSVMAQDCITGDTVGSSGSYFDVADEIFASKFIAGCTGTIDSARVWFYNFNNVDVEWQSYVYSYPDMDLLATSNTISGTATGAWSSWMVFSSPTTVDSGDVVLLGINSEGNILHRVYYTNAANDTTFHVSNVCCGSPPDPLVPTDTTSSYHLQIHGYMTASAVSVAGDVHSGDKHGSTLH